MASLRCCPCFLVTMAKPRMSSTSPSTPGDVIGFWFGQEWYSGGLDSADYESQRIKMWFMGGAEVDRESMPFVPLIRAAGQGKLTDAVWEDRDGLVARLVLLDQLTRNVFRGSAEAFAYDGEAQRVATRLIDESSARPASLPWPASLFCATCLMHSEDLALHERTAIFLREHVRLSQNSILSKSLESSLPEHTAVIRRFGRYPHRNGMFGRKTTTEEQEWLDSDECPGWAKSQMKTPPRAKGK